MTPLVPAGLNSSPPGWSPTWPAADRDSAEAEFQPGGIPYSIALDSAGDVWTANNSGNPASVTQLPAPVTASTIAQIYHPADAALSDCLEIALDYAGNVWVVNRAAPLEEELGGSVSELMSPVTSATLGANFAPSGAMFVTPYSLALDNAGNIWVANCGLLRGFGDTKAAASASLPHR
jgi:streptogramin lyase